MVSPDNVIVEGSRIDLGISRGRDGDRPFVRKVKIHLNDARTSGGAFGSSNSASVVAPTRPRRFQHIADVRRFSASLTWCTRRLQTSESPASVASTACLCVKLVKGSLAQQATPGVKIGAVGRPIATCEDEFTSMCPRRCVDVGSSEVVVEYASLV